MVADFSDFRELLGIPLDEEVSPPEIEKDPELSRRRRDSGLIVIASNVLSGEDHLSNCIYDGSKLTSDYMFASMDEPEARQLKSCPQCGVKYDLPVTREEWVYLDSVAEKLREGCRRAEEASA